MKKALLVMAKRPFPGRTKTRLTPTFSETEAAALYECFLQDVLNIVRAVPDITPFIAYAPHEAETVDYFSQLAPDFELIPQIGDTLGERLDYVLSSTLQNGFVQAAAMNSDSPTLPSSYLADTFVRLTEPETDVVFGPCEDGGYYVIGWKRPYPSLVRNVQMSTPHVLQDTLALANAAHLRVSLLPSWYDVDEITEVRRLQSALLSSKESAPVTKAFLTRHHLE
jgi:rSAM/selenodomain-associated transferase 1